MGGRRKNLAEPDERIEAELASGIAVRLGDLTVGRSVQEPGWKWSIHMRPIVGGEWCQARHVGLVVSGRFRNAFEDGSTVDLEPGDVFDIGPGHDGWVVGEEPFVTIQWEGLRTWATPIGVGERILLSLVFTDLVGSTSTAARIGEQAWSDLLARHNEVVRASIARYRGLEVGTTGDGFLATFDGAARAIHFAVDVRASAANLGLRIRSGIHTGEVDKVGRDIRGIAVHEAARIMAAADADEILVSEVTHALATGSGASFGEGTTYELRGIEGTRVLYPVRNFA